MKFTAITSLIALCASVATAQETTNPVAPPNAGVAIIAPLLNSTVPAGTNYTIRWTLLDPNATTIERITLMNGNPLFLNTVLPNILTNGSINASDLAYNWTVPTNLTAGTDYALALLGNNTFTTYSPFFTITNATTNSTTNATTY